MAENHAGRVFVLTLAAVAGSIVYALHPPGLLYDVETGAWGLSVAEGHVAIGWYGRLLWLIAAGAGAGMAGALLLKALPGLRRAVAAPRAIRMFTVFLILAVAVCAGVVVQHEWAKWIAPSIR